MSQYKTEVNQLINMMQKHNAWFGYITGQEAEKILKPYSPHTFLLRAGTSDMHYFLSYVTHDSVVFHQSIRINKEAGGYYPNSGSGWDRNKIFKTIETLISEFLECQMQELLPLSNELSQVQGF